MTRDDHRWAQGTRAHYEDAAYYDRAYARRKDDVEFYVKLARRVGGPVLELGAGTGRVSCEIARAGVDIVAVDQMAPMIARGKERVAALPRAARPRVRFVRGDVRSVRVAKGRGAFRLVIAPFNVFMHLYTRRDVERALETVRFHLARGGTFAFDVLMPSMASLARDPARMYRSRPILRPDAERYNYTETFQYDPVRQVQLVTMAFQQQHDRKKLIVTPLAHRQFFPAELEALLHYNGFSIKRTYGDFTGSPLHADSESQVILGTLSIPKTSTTT